MRFSCSASSMSVLALGACLLGAGATAAPPSDKAAAEAAARFSQAMRSGDASLLRPILPRSGKVQLRLVRMGPERGYFSARQVETVLGDFLAQGAISSVEILRVERGREGFAVVHGRAAIIDRQGRPCQVELHLGLQPEAGHWVLREIRETPR